MEQPTRLTLHRAAEIAAPAEDVWALLTDWAGMLRWCHRVEAGNALRGIASCDLIGTADAVPRTRRITLGNGAAVEETLIHVDPAMRRLFYRKTDTGGTTNYLASSTVDAIGSDRSRLSIAAWLDVVPGGDPDRAAAWYEAVYGSIFAGFAAYFASH